MTLSHSDGRRYERIDSIDLGAYRDNFTDIVTDLLTDARLLHCASAHNTLGICQASKYTLRKGFIGDQRAERLKIATLITTGRDRSGCWNYIACDAGSGDLEADALEIVMRI
jgi:hypothetical protein